MRRQLFVLLIALTTFSSSRKPLGHINTSFLLMKANPRPNIYLFRGLQYRNFKKTTIPQPNQSSAHKKKSSDKHGEEMTQIHVKWYNRISKKNYS